MLKLFYHNTPNPTKVALLLEELAHPYEVVATDIWDGAQHTPEFRRINPNGKVPAIIDGDVVIFDSTAILLWLADRAEQFNGDDRSRPQMLSWLMFVASGLGPFCGQAFHFLNIHTVSAYATNRYARELERHFSVLDKHLTLTPWLAGSDYTIADMAAWGWVDFAVRNGLVYGEDGGHRWPALTRWCATINARPAADRARHAGDHLSVKQAFDEDTMRALFPQNYAEAL